jgi:hypothetical protein
MKNVIVRSIDVYGRLSPDNMTSVGEVAYQQILDTTK